MDEKHVLAATGLKKSTLYDWVAAGKFPCWVDLGIRRVIWRADQVLAWARDPDGWTPSTPSSPSAQLPAILWTRDLDALVPICRDSIFKLEDRGRFPKRLQSTTGRAGWRAADVLAWVGNL